MRHRGNVRSINPDMRVQPATLTHLRSAPLILQVSTSAIDILAGQGHFSRSGVTYPHETSGLAVQLALHHGAAVVGIAGESNADFLRSLGVIPVSHGAGVRDRILGAAPGSVTKLLDCYGGDYVQLGFSLGLRGPAIGTLVPSPRAIFRGARFTGSRHAQPGDLETVAKLVASGAVKTAIAHTYPFDVAAVRDAFAELAEGHVRGKLVVSLATS